MSQSNLAFDIRVDFQPVILALEQIAKAARYTADVFEQVNVMLGGRWPDEFIILSRRMRYGLREHSGLWYDEHKLRLVQ